MTIKEYGMAVFFTVILAFTLRGLYMYFVYKQNKSGCDKYRSNARVDLQNNNHIN